MPQKVKFRALHRGIIHSSQTVEATQLDLRWGNQREQTADTHVTWMQLRACCLTAVRHRGGRAAG